MNYTKTKAIETILGCLPQNISNVLSKLDNKVLERITEIRLHTDGVCGLTIDGKNYFAAAFGIACDCESSVIVSKADIDEFILKFCGGSIYTHEETLRDFFIVSDGIRVGLAASAVVKDGKISSISEIYSLNIRISRHIDGCSQEVYRHISSGSSSNGGVLIISPPGIGKTTLLRDLALKLSRGKIDFTTYRSMRVCVIDERCEIYLKDVFYKSPCDFLHGIPKVKGIEIATRLLSPQYIICDEIGNYEEAKSIINQTSSGTRFICSIHASSFNDVIKKEYIKDMFECGVFSSAYTLSRVDNKVSGELILYDDI